MKTKTVETNIIIDLRVKSKKQELEIQVVPTFLYEGIEIMRKEAVGLCRKSTKIHTLR